MGRVSVDWAGKEGGWTYYFHAKSRNRQSTGITRTMIQKTGEVKRRGMTPWYSVEKPSFGATVPYIGMNPIQMTMEPGIARTVYFVHMFVTNAAFPSTVARTAV